MKSFFKVFFAALVALVIFSLISFLILMGMIGSLSSAGSKAVQVKENSVLKISLENSIPDRTPSSFSNGLNDLATIGEKKMLGLNDYLKAIKRAKEDSKIKGVYLDLVGAGGNMPNLKELRDALADFKTSGKFIVAYGNYYSQPAYYLGSVADRVMLHKEGMIDFRGVSFNVMFFKNLLQKLGVEMQIIRHGKFKSAVEPYIYDKMSPENREQYTVLGESMWNTILKDVSDSRKIEVARLNHIADSLKAFFPQTALLSGLVDTLCVENDLRQYLMAKLSEKEEDKLNIVAVENYVKQPAETIKTENKIAVIYAQGQIGMSKGNDNEIGMENISKAIRKAAKDKNVKAIVLRVNSPGGSVLTSELIYNEIDLAKKEKPVVASFGNYAASGGYYISCACDKIIADPNTLTGSIGVFSMIPNVKKIMNEKLGISMEEVSTNKNSSFMATTRPLTPFETAIMQQQVEQVYAGFISKVAKGRGLSLEKVDSIGQGRVWTGNCGKELGLVDEIGGLNKAIEEAAKLAKIDTYRLSELPEQKDGFTALMEGLSGAKAGMIEQELGSEMTEVYRLYQSAKNAQGIQARLPFLIQYN